MIVVGDLVAHLDGVVPFAWAEGWDRVGLLAGSPEWPVAGVFASVDPTLDALTRAREMGATVLLTHHPVFLEPLVSVTDRSGGARVVFEALRAGVALVNCHTNMDRLGADALPSLLGLDMLEPLEPEGEDSSRPRMGRICAGAGMTLASLSSTVGEKLGVRTRAWGDADAKVSRIAVAPGSGRSLVAAALAAGCDAFVTGELRYHEAREALEAGLVIVEAGHDATERPLTRALAAIAAATPGLDETPVVVDEAPYPWWIA